MLEIQSGVTRVNSKSWLYEYRDNEGLHKVVFTADVYPQIGDFISGGIHIPRTEPKVNPDTSKWKQYHKKTWGN